MHGIGNAFASEPGPSQAMIYRPSNTPLIAISSDPKRSINNQIPMNESVSPLEKKRTSHHSTYTFAFTPRREADRSDIMSVIALLSSALISCYPLFPSPIPVVVSSLLSSHLLRLHQLIFYYAVLQEVPLSFIIKPFISIFLAVVFWLPCWVLSRCFRFSRVLMISLALRKRYFHDRVAGRIRQGSLQVLILGAGYDALAAVFAEMYPNVLFVEADLPRMSQRKKLITEQAGKRRDNLVFLGIDLSTENLEEKLLKEVPEWDITKKSVVTAESLFMFLEPKSVRRCMCSIRAVTPSNTMIAFSYAQKQKLHSQSFSYLSQLVFAMFLRPMKWIANDVEEVANIIEGDEFYAELAPHETDLYRKYLRDTQFGIENHPFYRNFNGMAMSK